MRLECTRNDIRQFCETFTPIKHDYMATQVLSSEIENLGRIFFGREIELTQKNDLLSEIRRRFVFLSCNDIKIAFTRIIDSRTDTGKYFNVTEIMRVISQVASEKNKIRDRYFQYKREDQESTEAIIEYNKFMQECLKKFKSQQLMNVYEKAAVGRYFEKEIDAAADILSIADMKLVEFTQALNNLQESRLNRAANISSFSIFGDLEKDPEEPIFWTKQLVYGRLLFDQIKA